MDDRESGERYKDKPEASVQSRERNRLNMASNWTWLGLRKGGGKKQNRERVGKWESLCGREDAE